MLIVAMIIENSSTGIFFMGTWHVSADDLLGLYVLNEQHVSPDNKILRRIYY